MPTTTVARPLPGTFHPRSVPDQPAFGEAGDAVAAGETVALVEVTESFTPVAAGAGGGLVRFHVEDGDAVTPEQPPCDIAS